MTPELEALVRAGVRLPSCEGCGTPVIQKTDPCSYCGRHTPDSLARFAKGPDPKATAILRKITR